ncbi:MAG: hypothetical protein HYT76_05410 [Deltaproteobacteria bacterium]|nr:hypothetical protein [Deltaproteobacteria bacterium]
MANDIKIRVSGATFGGGEIGEGSVGGAEVSAGPVLPEWRALEFLAGLKVGFLANGQGLDSVTADAGVGVDYSWAETNGFDFLDRTTLEAGAVYERADRNFDPDVGLRQGIASYTFGSDDQYRIGLDFIARADPTGIREGRGMRFLGALTFEFGGARLSRRLPDELRKELEEIGKTDLGRRPVPSPRTDWHDLYAAVTYDSLKKGESVSDYRLREGHEAILFQPVAIMETDGKITQLSEEGIRQWVLASLEAHREKGVPIEQFDILIRRQPKVFRREAIDTSGKNTAVPLEGGWEFDQDEKVRIFGAHSKRLAYSFQIIPTKGRSQSTGVAMEQVQKTLSDPKRLMKYIHAGRLWDNFSKMRSGDLKDPKKWEAAILGSLWDGEEFGWRAALRAMSDMEGYVSQVFVGDPTSEGLASRADSADVSTHEGLTVHFLNLVDEYGRGEFTEVVDDLRKKWIRATGIDGPDKTPPIFELLHNLRIRPLINELADQLQERGLGPVAKLVVKLGKRVPADLKIDLSQLERNDLVEALIPFELLNVAFSPDELWKKFDRFIVPNFPHHNEFRRLLCVKEGGLQEEKGVYHFEWKEGARVHEWVNGGWRDPHFQWFEKGSSKNLCDNPQDTNAEKSHSTTAPLSPFAIVILYEMGAFGGKFKPYWDRPLHRPIQ